MFDHLNPIFNYLVSIIRLDDHIQVNVKFLSSWQVNIFAVEGVEILAFDGKGELGYSSYSFIGKFDPRIMANIMKIIQEIIKFNLEKEKKEVLFEKTINELKNIFDKSDLSSLSELFSGLEKINKPKTKIVDETGGQATDGPVQQVKG